MKKGICILLSLLIIHASFAQQIRRDSIPIQKGYVGILVGVGLPIFDYSSKNIANNNAGFAKPGLNIEASLTKILVRETGFVLTYKYQANPIDGQSLLNQYTYKYPSINWTITNTPWKVNAFMAGLYHSSYIKEIKGVSADFKMIIGLIQASSPQTIITGQQGSNKASAEQSAVNGKSFAYGFGLGLKFDVGQHLYILLQADYLGTNAKFNNVTTQSSSGTSATNNFSQKINTINLSAGLAYRIN